MNWYYIFYLVSILDNLHNVFLAFFIFSGAIAVISLLFWIFSERISSFSHDKSTTVPTVFWIEFGPVIRRLMLIFWPLFIIFLSLFVTVPTRNSAMLIVSGGLVGEYIQSDSNLRELPEEATEWLKLQFQSEIIKLRNANKIEALESNINNLTKEELKDKLIEKMLKENTSSP